MTAVAVWDHRPSPEELLQARLQRGWQPTPTETREGIVILGYAACLPAHLERSTHESAMGNSWVRRISRRGLIPGIHASKTGRLVALASRDPATARAWCDEFKILKSHESYQELLDDPEIDAVYIPLPNELHKPWVVAAADAGKHVLCEKPLALNAVEAREMVEQCRSRGVLLMEAFHVAAPAAHARHSGAV